MKCQGTADHRKRIQPWQTNAPVLQHRSAWKGVKAMYTDYGYLIDGIEYATVDEAYEAAEDDETEAAE